MTQMDRPAPGSHDRSTPSGTLETSAANLFEAMLAAREAEERGEPDPRTLHGFYRTLMSGTLLLPVPPEHGDEAKQALAAAVDEDEQVEISVMLAREGDDGAPVSVLFGSVAALAAWAPAHTANLPLPARIAIANLAAAGLPAIMDPAGPVPYRFDLHELTELAEGRLPGTDDPLFEPTSRMSIRVRLPGRDVAALEASLSTALAGTFVDAAYLVETDGPDGRPRLMLGLLGEPGATVTVDVPEQTEVVWLEEPLLGQVRAVAEPFHGPRARR